MASFLASFLAPKFRGDRRASRVWMVLTYSAALAAGGLLHTNLAHHLSSALLLVLAGALIFVPIAQAQKAATERYLRRRYAQSPAAA